MDLGREITILDVSPENIGEHLQKIEQLYKDEGAVILPGFLRKDAIFKRLIADLSELTQELGSKNGIAIDSNDALDSQISQLAHSRRDLAGKIYDIGTRPNKLLSGMMLKVHPALIDIVKHLFPRDALIATPALSDTLHVFPPGGDSFRFNLPIHQDYPYLLQSPNQVTFWISLSRHHADVGGMSLWCGSQKLGVCKHKRDANGHLECIVDSHTLSSFREVRCKPDFGDVVIFHSNILHRSEKNYTLDRTRLVQLFRFSDLHDEEAKRITWENADIHPRAKKFEDFYPELVIS